MFFGQNLFSAILRIKIKKKKVKVFVAGLLKK